MSTHDEVVDEAPVDEGKGFGEALGDDAVTKLGIAMGVMAPPIG